MPEIIKRKSLKTKFGKSCFETFLPNPFTISELQSFKICGLPVTFKQFNERFYLQCLHFAPDRFHYSSNRLGWQPVQAKTNDRLNPTANGNDCNYFIFFCFPVNVRFPADAVRHNCNMQRIDCTTISGCNVITIDSIGFCCAHYLLVGHGGCCGRRNCCTAATVCTDIGKSIWLCLCQAHGCSMGSMSTEASP